MSSKSVAGNADEEACELVARIARREDSLRLSRFLAIGKHYYMQGYRCAQPELRTAALREQRREPNSEAALPAQTKMTFH